MPRISCVGTGLKQTFVYYFQTKVLESPNEPLETPEARFWFSNDLLPLETLLRASRAFLPACLTPCQG